MTPAGRAYSPAAVPVVSCAMGTASRAARWAVAALLAVVVSGCGDDRADVPRARLRADLAACSTAGSLYVRAGCWGRAYDRLGEGGSR